MYDHFGRNIFLTSFLICCFNLKKFLLHGYTKSLAISKICIAVVKKITIWLRDKNFNSKWQSFICWSFGQFLPLLSKARVRLFEAKRQHLTFHIWATLPNLDLFIFSWFWRHTFTLRGIHIGFDLEFSMWGCNPGPSWP